MAQSQLLTENSIYHLNSSNTLGVVVPKVLGIRSRRWPSSSRSVPARNSGIDGLLSGSPYRLGREGVGRDPGL